MPDDRTYIRVHDGMPDHPKVDGLSDGGFRLLITLWCWCARHLTDGHVPDATWRKRGTAKARRELIACGHAEQVPGGVQMHDYLEHQRSAEQIRRLRGTRNTASTAGNHKRWHLRRGVTDPDCDLCTDPTDPKRDPKRDADRSPERSLRDDPATVPERSLDTDTDTEPPSPPLTTFGEGTPPSPRCARHVNDPDPPPCRACAEARTALDAHTAAEQAQHRRDQSQRRSTQARQQAETRAGEVARCRLCDDAGYLPNGPVCGHDPAVIERAKRGAAAARSAIRTRETT